MRNAARWSEEGAEGDRFKSGECLSMLMNLGFMQVRAQKFLMNLQIFMTL